MPGGIKNPLMAGSEGIAKLEIYDDLLNYPDKVGVLIDLDRFERRIQWH